VTTHFQSDGAATLDLENNSLTGVETVVPSPDNHGQLDLDGLLALTPRPSRPRPPTGASCTWTQPTGR
jgi:hypothetical protein